MSFLSSIYCTGPTDPPTDRTDHTVPAPMWADVKDIKGLGDPDVVAKTERRAEDSIRDVQVAKRHADRASSDHMEAETQVNDMEGQKSDTAMKIFQMEKALADLKQKHKVEDGLLVNYKEELQAKKDASDKAAKGLRDATKNKDRCHEQLKTLMAVENQKIKSRRPLGTECIGRGVEELREAAEVKHVEEIFDMTTNRIEYVYRLYKRCGVESLSQYRKKDGDTDMMKDELAKLLFPAFYDTDDETSPTKKGRDAVEAHKRKLEKKAAQQQEAEEMVETAGGAIKQAALRTLMKTPGLQAILTPGVKKRKAGDDSGDDRASKRQRQAQDDEAGAMTPEQRALKLAQEFPEEVLLLTKTAVKFSSPSEENNHVPTTPSGDTADEASASEK